MEKVKCEKTKKTKKKRGVEEERGKRDEDVPDEKVSRKDAA